MKKKEYKFSKNKHVHTLDDIPLHGVTTVLSVVAKPQLIPWASKMAIEYIKIHGKKTPRKKEWLINEEELDKAKNAHAQKKTSAGDIGTTVHETIEQWIKVGCPTEMPIQVFCNNDIQVTKMFEPFIEWAFKNNVEFIATERHVHSEKHWIGGIVDFVCMIDGKRIIGDIKTSSGIYPEHFMQMGAYDLCLQEMGEPKADGYVIINLRKDGTIRIKRFNETKKFQDAFLNALGLYKALKTMKWDAHF